ncbi:MAG: polysulfide reductase NrfD [Deltaproteobacteria bacterium]|nr:polysulfide reductase NrfD [Deltaproteobacteria bacterium]
MSYLNYWRAMIRCALRSRSRGYYLWLLLLLGGCAVGVLGYSNQLRHGLVVTNLTSQVSWGAYIANFTFLVGIAAAAVLLVVPSYAYDRKDVKSVVLFGELMAISAIVMCLAFVTVDLGRPDRILHLMPFIGRMNFPHSVLAWDVIVLSGYLLLNLHIPGYLLYKRYRGEEPTRRYYLPFVFISIGWAISIHTVTAFLYSGLGGRPFWNSAILAPRFLVSAFASGPALLLLVFALIDRFSELEVPSTVSTLLRKIITFTLPLNLFLLGCELFTEFYTDSAHLLSASYLFFGIGKHKMLVPYIWSGLALQVFSIVVFLHPRLYGQRLLLGLAAVVTVLGVWIEKGMGLIIPGFIPTPAGDLVEYTPSLSEFAVCLGIWSLGALLFTLMAKVALAIVTGRLRANHP